MEKWPIGIGFGVGDKKGHRGCFQPEREKFHFATIHRLRLILVLERKISKKNSISIFQNVEPHPKTNCSIVEADKSPLEYKSRILPGVPITTCGRFRFNSRLF